MLLPLLVLAQTALGAGPRVTSFPQYDAELEFSAATAPVLRPGLLAVVPDTVRRRPRAIRLSYSYYRRLDAHRWAGFAVLPLFAVEYLAGERLLEKGSAAPLWAEKAHKPAAYALAGVFTFNTVTGVWNLAEAKKVQSGKTRRWVHAIAMLAADAGFIYAAHIAPSTDKIDKRIAAGTVGGWTPHKRAAVASMSVATAAYVMMWLWKE